MVFGYLLRNDQPKEYRNGPVIGRVEGNGSFRSHQDGGCCVAACQARMRDRNALTQARRAQLLACGEAIQNFRVG